MAKKKKIDLKLIVAEALEYYHNYVKKTIKESTKRQNESLLSEFYRFVDTLPARDKTMKIFSQKGLNRYKEYLIDKMERSKTDGRKRNFGVGQLNRCGSMIARLINNVLCPQEVVPNRVVWVKVEDPRREDQKGHFPLLDNEVTAIENCSGLTPVDEEYRDIFLLQIECGQRVSDLAKILTGKYRVKQGKIFEYIIISTIKENIKAHIPLRPKMRMLMEKVNSHKLIDPVKFEKRVNGKGNGTYNEAIRRIAKKAGLDREIVRMDSLLLEVRGPLYEEITNHAARCTFITNMLKKGVSTERLSKMTGHASDEMIKRVYAQLTEDDEINLIESNLYSDMDDDVANIPTDSSSINPSELKSEEVVAEEMPNDSITDTHEYVLGKVSETLPINNPDSSNQFKFEDYINGLDDVVNSALREMEQMLNDFYEMDTDIKTFFEMKYNEIRNQIIKDGIKSKEDIRRIWDYCLDFCKKDSEDLEENEKGFEDTYKILYIHAMMDYCKENNLEEGLISMLEGLDKEVNEENPLVYFFYKIIQWDKEVLPAIFMIRVLIKTLRYMFLNRPKCASLIIDGNKNDYSLIRIPDVPLMINELRRIPASELQAIIQKIDLDYDSKVKLYQSIVNGNSELFADIMNSSENKLIGLVELTYLMNFLIGFLRKYDKASNEISDVFKEITDSDVYLLNNNPFSDFEFTLSGGLEKFGNEDNTLFIMNLYLADLELFKKFSSPSEKRIINNVLRLIDRYPKLRQSYDDYRQGQQATSDFVEDKLEPHYEERVKNVEKTVKKQKVGTNYITFNSENIDIDKLIRLLTEKDKLNKYHQFITVLESTDNVNVATCLKHFLGTTSNTPLSFTLKWNGRTKVSLKFLIRLITNTNEEASRLNVIDESEYDGISPEYVSQWAGSGELWAPVCEVFGGSTGYMMSVGLGDEGTKARNLEQYNTIADIYFACKK